MIQAMNEETIDMAKENAINAKKPVRLKAGRSSQYEENPAKLNETILNPSATSVTK